MEKVITINYESNNKPNVYKQTINLGPDTDQDYFTGKQRSVQMTALSNALDTALANAKNVTISSVNGVNFEHMPIADFLNMLNRQDDYLATTLFEPADEATKVESSEAQGTNVQQKETKSKNTLAVQKVGHKSYKSMPIDDEIADDDKINKIGNSKLLHPIFYKDLKPLLKDESIFENPLGMVPSNGSITAKRKKSFATNSKLNSLDGYKEQLVGQVLDSSGSPYKLFMFTKTAPEKEEPQVEAAPESKPEPQQVKKKDNQDMEQKQVEQINSKLDEILATVKNATPLTDLPSEEEPMENDNLDYLDLPDEVIEHMKETDPQAKAAYLFQLIQNMASGNQDPTSLALIKDPKLFLKAVNKLSCD